MEKETLVSVQFFGNLFLQISLPAMNIKRKAFTEKKDFSQKNTTGCW